MPLRQAVIMAGGLGTRLGTLTQSMPKPMVPVAGRPFLDYLLWNLKRQGIRRILLSIGYLGEQIEEYARRAYPGDLEIETLVEDRPMGTGGGLKLAEERLEDAFLVLNGDTIFDLNYHDLFQGLQDGGREVVLSLLPVEDTARYGRVELDAKGHCTSFGEKSAGGPGLISGGVYAMRKSALRFLPEGPSSLEVEMMPRLVEQGLLGGRVYDNFFLDIGTPASYEQAQEVLPAWQRRPAVFFDRDGVICHDLGYVHKPEDFRWITRAPEAVKWCNDHGYFAILITNQAGIGRGYYSEEHFLDFTQWVQDQLHQSGAYLDAVYYCPHHPTEAKGRYRVACDCRKPEPGMLEKALSEWPIIRGKSIFIGDKPSDQLAAQRAEIRGCLFEQGDLLTALARHLAAF